MTQGADGKHEAPDANAPSALDEENEKVQAALDEMNRIAYGYKEPPPTEKDKVGAVASFVVATVAAVFVPGIPWVLTWVVVFAGMTFLLKYMRED